MAQAAPRGVIMKWHHEQIEQNPEAPGFWEKWESIFKNYGWKPGDIFVSSEPYGKILAEKFGGTFYPYDLGREIMWTKGTQVREDPARQFDAILPEFQPYLRQTVTFLGAESVGKTSLSKWTADHFGAWWTMEWARPYLESLDDKTITVPVMNDIWRGQKALQWHSYRDFLDLPWIVQDTDLFATVGYWNFWSPATIPAKLVTDASLMRSDLYIIPRSNIPYEADPIRYGDGVRESSDQYWIDLCERHNLNYVVLESGVWDDRCREVVTIMKDHWKQRVTDRLHYERKYNG